MNSRALHEELGIKTKHADWIARKIALLDLEHVIPEGFETFKGEVVVSSLLGTPHKDILKSIRKEVKDLQECQSAKIFADCLEELEIASTEVVQQVGRLPQRTKLCTRK